VGWRAHVQCVVRSDLVVLPEPSVDCDLGLFGGVEPFSVAHFFSQGPVKALVVSCVGKTVSHTVF
jgi:hypothetical protein